jgi:NAD(P)-dependent dehydrogenase (short-subunit alcohol dehydrogenase family)
VRFRHCAPPARRPDRAAPNRHGNAREGAALPRYGALRALNVESRSLKREETPDDLVGALLFLACHDSDFMTGQTLLVDDGPAMH